MFRWNEERSRALLKVTLVAAVLAMFYVGASFAQTGDVGRHVTMSERIGVFVVLFRAFDVWIYFFQAILLFFGLGLILLNFVNGWIGLIIVIIGFAVIGYAKKGTWI